MALPAMVTRTLVMPKSTLPPAAFTSVTPRAAPCTSDAHVLIDAGPPRLHCIPGAVNCSVRDSGPGTAQTG